jgi:hypothetical protein
MPVMLATGAERGFGCVNLLLLGPGWLQWHLGFYQRAYTPLARGFDEHLGYYQGCVDYYKHTGGGYGGMSPGTGE